MIKINEEDDSHSLKEKEDEDNDENIDDSDE